MAPFASSKFCIRIYTIKVFLIQNIMLIIIDSCMYYCIVNNYQLTIYYIAATA